MHGNLKKRLVGAAVIVAAIPAMCIAHPGHPPIPTPTITVTPKAQPIPFELFRGNRIVIPARINGHETRVLLDTGASMTTLNRSYARSIGVPRGFKMMAKGAGGDVESELVLGLNLAVGGLEIKNATVGVLDLAALEQSMGRPISAILGRDFFKSAVISIDWASKRLEISAPDAFRPGATAVAVELAQMGPFSTVPVSIAGSPPIPALLDLGNGGALALPRSYWGGRPELVGLRSAATMAGGVGGMHSARATVIPQVTLGGTVLKSVPAILSDSGSNDDPTQMANVGIGLLKQFRIDFDLAHDRMYLTSRSDRPSFDRDRAGVMFNLTGNRLKASFVSRDGPAAAAGLKEGDEFVAVDGRLVTPSYYESADWTRGSAGNAVVLTRSDGSKVKVTLADYY